MDYLLWADFETTGLEPRMDTVLEAAWTITDADLRMLTPLRSRLCLIDPPNRCRDAIDFPEHPLKSHTRFTVGRPGDDKKNGLWHLLNQVVQDMHDMSGLKDSLVHSVSDPVAGLSMLTTNWDLGRLIKEDLALIPNGFDPKNDKLILAGAGVSHFDNRVFDHHLPGMFPLGGGGFLNYAYWQHDVSVAWRVLGPQVFERLRMDALNLPLTHSIYRCEKVTSLTQGYAPVHLSFTTTMDMESPEDVAFLPGELVSHRAADDVVRALIDGRILRAATGWGVK